MAKILGFEVKAVKSFKDHEGYPIHQGNVYFKGKKLGFWSQDDWGGPDHYDFDICSFEHALAEIDVSCYPIFNGCANYGITLNLDILMEELLHLKNTEKEFKKIIKSGYDKMLSFENGNSCCFVGINNGEESKIDEITSLVFKEVGWRDMSEVKVSIYDDTDLFVIGEALAVA